MDEERKMKKRSVSRQETATGCSSFAVGASNRWSKGEGNG